MTQKLMIQRKYYYSKQAYYTETIEYAKRIDDLTVKRTNKYSRFYLDQDYPSETRIERCFKLKSKCSDTEIVEHHFHMTRNAFFWLYNIYFYDVSTNKFRYKYYYHMSFFFYILMF
jgi:hypothetical protein